MEKQIGVFHQFIYDKLKERFPYNKYIPRKTVANILIMHTVPKVKQQDFLKEMEHYNLIKIVNKQKIMLN